MYNKFRLCTVKQILFNKENKPNIKRIITFALTLLLLASAFCVEAFAAPNYIYSDSTTASGKYKNKAWYSELRIYASSTATATITSSYKGLLGVSMTATAYYKKGDGTLDFNRTQTYSKNDGIINASNGSQSVSVQATTTAGNLAYPLLYAKANYKVTNVTVSTLKLDFT